VESSSEPWWKEDPTIRAFKEQACADFQKAIEEAKPIDHERANEPDPVTVEFYSGRLRRGLVAARDRLAKARANYDDTVIQARAAGMSWGEIATLLGVARQQLHRRYRDRS